MQFVRPGIASRLPPNGGIQNEWITSADVIATRTGLPDGTCSSLAVVRPRSRYLNSHHHWWPITSTLRASAGASPAVAKMVRTVGTATNTRMTAGASVQAISMRVWPCVGFGSGRPSRWRKRTSATRSISSTTTNTAAAHEYPELPRLDDPLHVLVVKAQLFRREREVHRARFARFERDATESR